MKSKKLKAKSKKLTIKSKNLTTTKNGKVSLIDFGKQDVRSLIESIVEGFDEGVDFGKPFERAKKNEIYKPGCEKVCLRFNIEPHFFKDTETLEMIGTQKVIAYKCILIHRPTGQRVGEGRGVCLIGERKDMTINSSVKMAEIRAQKDAVLRTFSLSNRFTQDQDPKDIANKETKKIKIDAKGDVIEL